MHPFEPAEIRSIAVVWIGRLGDFLITIPFLHALKRRFPGAAIAAVVGERGREAAELCPAVDEVLTWGPLPATLKLGARLVRGFDLVIDLNSSFSKTSVALCRLARAPRKLAFHRHRGNAAFTHTEAFTEELHMWDRYGRLAKALGAPYDVESPAGFPDQAPLPLRLAPDEEAAGRAAVRGSASGGGAVVLIHPGNFKKFENPWPEDSYVELTDRLLERGGVSPVYLAGPGEEEPVRAIAGRASRPCPVVGPMSLAATAGALKEASLLIVNATGTAHLAALLRVPTFTFLSRYTAKTWMASSGPLHHHVLSGSWESCRDIPVSAAWSELEPFLASLERRAKTVS
ncbi:MAG: glycosyltransferase family 9 protein [Elusimicrobia bacterium]|nr:glycosyltransferase family 9 protein [Elusimicrobiota bacterium]